MAYAFKQIEAHDPNNPGLVAPNASVTIFEPGDPTKTPLTLTTLAGDPLPNPVTVNGMGYGPAFMHATLSQVAWSGGGLTGTFESYEGMRDEAVAARAAAETAAATAGADAAAVADAAIGDATAEAEAAAASAAAAEAAAASSATAAANSASLVGAPADTAIAAAINGSGTATKTALSATIDTQIGASPTVTGKLDKTEAASTYAPQSTTMRVSDLFLSIGKYGVPGADNTAIIAQAFTDAGTAVSASGPRSHDGTYGPASRAVYFPAGVWTTTASVVVPRGVSVTFANGAVLRATAAIAAPLLDTTSLAWEGQSITGGTIDCNLLAQDGIRVRVGRYSTIRDVHIDDPTRHGVVLGDTTLSPSSFEMYLHKVTARRRTGQALVAGSQGVAVTAKCSDSVLDTCVAISFETGFSNSGGDNRFLSCHAWGFAGAFPHYAFDDISGSYAHYSQCVADSPSVAGFRFRVGYASMSQCTVFLANSQADNTVAGVALDAGAAYFNASNNRFQGASSSVRLSSDYLGADTAWLNTSNVEGQMTFNAVTKLPTPNTFAPYSLGGQLAEARYYVPGAVAAGDMPISVFWTVPVQADTVLIRANSGTGSQFQVWQGGTQLTPTFNAGDIATLNSPFGSGTPVKLAANQGIYIKCVTAGTGQNLSIVFKARLNG